MDKVDNLKNIFDYEFINTIDDDLILLASTPKGGKLSVNDRKRLIEKYQDDNNDALEYVGDTVLELVVADSLFAKKLSAGLMTKISSIVVRNVSLICLMNDKNLCDLTKIITKECADLFEAYVGAVYIHLKQYEGINVIEVVKQWMIDVWDIEYMINYAIEHPNEENICKGIEKKYDYLWELGPPDLSHIQNNYKKLQTYYDYFHLGQILMVANYNNRQWVVKIKCPLATGCQYFVDKSGDVKYIGVGYAKNKEIAVDYASRQAIDLLLNDYKLK